MSDKKPYAAPTVTTIGSVSDLTLANNKIGGSTDAFSPALVGSLVAFP